MSGIMVALVVFSVLIALGLGTVAGLFIRKLSVGKRLAQAEQEAAQVLERAESQQKSLLLEAKEESMRLRSSAESEARDRRREFQQREQRFSQREESLERRMTGLEQREGSLSIRENGIEEAYAEQDQLKQKQLIQMEEQAGMTRQEVRDQLFKKIEDESRYDLGRTYMELEQQYKEEADEKARKYITLSIQRLASDVVSENSVATVPLPNDEMKGRLIGREGRNIRAIEKALGVDLIVDDTPEAVTVSCFDPVRRAVATLALSNLVQDGRIHPTRVEEMAVKAEQEIDLSIKKAGEEAIFEAGVRGMDPELVKLLGRLKYRSSYGGNVLQHSVQASLIAGMLAAEIGANVETSKMGALLHDIGKALTHEIEGPHAEIGAEMAAKFRISEPVRRAIEEHHDEDKGSVEAFIVVAADAISSARPGARKDTLERYTKRLQDLEEVTRSFPGVEKCFAIQAGREVRVMVQPDNVDDVGASTMARDISKKIADTLVYPGQIKVTVIRETRSVEYAR
jgi:ribonuclease Y